MRVALSNIENLATQNAMVSVIRRHHSEIKLVILSDPYSEKNGGFLTQLVRNFKRRGMGFVNYLCIKMTAMPSLRLCLKLLGKKPLPSIANVCKEYQIPCIKVKDINAKYVIDTVKLYDIDLLTIFYFDQILQDDMIQAPNIGVVNFHPAYLPSCRGLFPILFSYLYNDARYGISAHWVTNTEIDAGPIIAQCSVECAEPTSVLQLDRVVCDQFTIFYPKVMALLEQDKAVLAPTSTSTGSYYSYPDKTHLKALRARGLPFLRGGDIITLMKDTVQ